MLVWHTIKLCYIIVQSYYKRINFTFIPDFNIDYNTRQTIQIQKCYSRITQRLQIIQRLIFLNSNKTVFLQHQLINFLIYWEQNIIFNRMEVIFELSKVSERFISASQDFNKYFKNQSKRKVIQYYCQLVKENIVIPEQNNFDKMELFQFQTLITGNISLRVYLKLYNSFIQLEVVLLKNKNFLTIKSKNLKILMYRHFNKINSTLIGYNFKINPSNGSISFDQKFLFSSQIQKSFLSAMIYTFDRGNLKKQEFNIFQLQKYFQKEIKICYELLSIHLIKILYIAGQISQTLYNNQSQYNLLEKKIRIWQSSSQMNFQYRSNPHDATHIQNQILQFTKTTMIYNQYQYEFMYDSRIKKYGYQLCEKSKKLEKSKASIQQHIQSLKNSTNLAKYFQQNQIGSIFNQTQKSLSLLQNAQNWISKYQQILIKYLILPIPKTLNEADSINIYANICILNANNLPQSSYYRISQSSNSILQRLKIRFIYVKDQTIDLNIRSNYQKIVNETKPKDILTKLVVIKKNKDTTNNSKINHEKQILSKISELGSPHIAKYYKTNQKIFSQALIMDYYQLRSFAIYLNQNILTASLMTKLYLICQTIQGLKFLRDNKIVHLDIKKQNLLIGKTLITRIADFGEAYHKKIQSCQNNYYPGYSIPYVAPQIFNKQIRQVPNEQPYDEKTDVYSVGILLYELINGIYPINISKFGHQKLISYYKNMGSLNNKILICPETNHHGLEKILDQLTQLSLKCMRVNKKQRPFLDWILIQLRQSIIYIDKFY